MKRVVMILIGLCSSAQLMYGQFLPQATESDEEALMKSEERRYTMLKNVMLKPASDLNIDVKYYKLNIAVTTSPNYLRGVVTMRARSVVASLATVTLDLMNPLTVDSIKTGTTRLLFAQQPTTLTITLDRSYASGEMVSMDIYYRGVPGSSGFGSFSFSTHGTPATPWVYTLSEPYGAKDWWPCKDHPSDKADSVDIWVTVDSTFKVGSEGKLVAVINNGNGTKTYQWAERYPISTYLVSMAITNFSELLLWFKYTPTDSMPVLNYVLPEHLASAQTNLPRTINMLTVYSARYGLYPFINEKYGHSEFGWGGGMEHQTMTSLNGFSESLVAHELAHMWYGDMITCANWPNIWLNEGFATYSVAVYYEGQYGFSNYTTYINGIANGARNAVGTIYVQDTSTTNTLFNQNLVYYKGAWVLHMLRHVLGDSAFYRSMRTYSYDPRFRFGVATTENFKEVCETVSGVSLGYFFNQWIYGEKYPRYTYSWRAIPDSNGGYIVPIRIQQSTQTTNPTYFTMPVDFRLAGAGLDTTFKLWNNSVDQSFSVHVPTLPTTGQLDPNNWILKTATVASIGDDGSLVAPFSYRLEQNYPNPFNPTTTVNYQLPRMTHVTLKVYDVLGREVATLVDGVEELGYKSVQWNATNVASVIYYYQLKAGGFMSTKRLLLMK
ncbi:MAG TPA: peptidase M1 [Bacteroidetes bacterium]|nr:peptidase M1 [Bacteroidota bacterium]